MFREEQPVKKPAVKSDNMFARIAKSDMETLKKAQSLLVKNGIKKATNRLDLYMKLWQLYKLKGEAIVPSIIAIHPDKKHFEAYYTSLYDKELNKLKDEYEQKIKDLKLDLRFEGIKKYGDDGGIESKSNKSGSGEFLPYIALIGAIGILSVTIISLNKSKN